MAVVVVIAGLAQPQVVPPRLPPARPNARGDITIWLSQAAIAAWEPDGTGTRGAQRTYSDVAIETALTLRLLFHLPLRRWAPCVALSTKGW